MFLVNTNTADGIKITFPNSNAVSVYPCGRRRFIGADESYIPFDPEARLNTEHNNRKLSSKNGYSQTYIDSIDIYDKDTDVTLYKPYGEASFSLAGYNFRLVLTPNICSGIEISKNTVKNGEDYLGKAIIAALEDSTSTAIFANIIIETTSLVQGDTLEYKTWVIRNQTDIDFVNGLDLFDDNTNNYYFSGLSFSTTPITKESDKSSSECIIEQYDEKGDVIKKQMLISLKLLIKDNDHWKINQQAILPNIRHGSEENSVEIDTLNALYGLTQGHNSIPVVSLKIDKSSNDPDASRLVFFTRFPTNPASE